MEHEASRRDFLRTVGLVGVSGLAAGCSSQSGAQTAGTETTVPVSTQNGEVASISRSFLVELGMTSEFDPAAGEVLAGSPWSLSSEAALAVPMLLRSFTPSEDDVDEFADEVSRDVMPSAITRGVTSDPFSALMGTRISNPPDVLDIASAAMLAVLDGAELNLDLDFFHADPSESSSVRTISARSGLPVVEEDEESVITRANPKPPSITLNGWKFQVRSIEEASLGSCVKPPTKVKHFNVEIHHQRPNGSFRKVMNVHLGTYKDPSSKKRCFVMYENKLRDRKGKLRLTCWKVCLPKMSDLVEILVWVLAAAAVVALVVIAAKYILAIATAAAAILFPALLVLA